MHLSRQITVLIAVALMVASAGKQVSADTGVAGQALPACSALVSPSASQVSGTWDIALRTEADIPAAIAAMTIAEKVGQMVQADVSTASPDDIRQYQLGSITSTVPRGDLGTTAAWRELFDAYQRAALQTRTGIPVVTGIDAVHGHAYFDGDAVILPHNIGLGATRNPELVGRLARVTARELSATGIRWTFSPTIAVARDVRWGRTYESFGEDVELQKMFAAALVEGYQGTDLAADDSVGATAKHFVADGATDGGVDRGNATISDAEIRSMHMPGFVAAIEQGVVSVMASFSSINGEKVHPAETVIIVVGETPYAERDGDRAAVDLVLSHEQRELIARYHDAGKQVVTVLISGRPLLVSEELEQSAAFVAAWLPGSEGRGIGEVLFGDDNFKGKLGFSWPQTADQIPINIGDPDYEPLFEYGFGLTY